MVGLQAPSPVCSVKGNAVIPASSHFGQTQGLNANMSAGAAWLPTTADKAFRFLANVPGKNRSLSLSQGASQSVYRAPRRQATWTDPASLLIRR
jgi:hypothetical protein